MTYKKINCIRPKNGDFEVPRRLLLNSRLYLTALLILENIYNRENPYVPVAFSELVIQTQRPEPELQKHVNELLKTKYIRFVTRDGKQGYIRNEPPMEGNMKK